MSLAKVSPKVITKMGLQENNCRFRVGLKRDGNLHLHETYRVTNINPLSANPTKWSNTFKQFVDNLPTNCLSVFDHFVKLALKGLKISFSDDLMSNVLLNVIFDFPKECFTEKHLC